MESERRHELEENSLARAMRKAPELIWEYGAYALLAVAVVVAVYFYFRNRTVNAQLERQATAQGLYNMLDAVNGLERLRTMAVFVPAETLQQQTGELRANFETYAELANRSTDPGTLCHALRLRGDFAWAMATLPSPDAGDAATQPATGPSTAPVTRPATRPSLMPATDWLAQAEAAYRQVVERYPKQTADNLAALFGLAAIAEQRGNFGAAGEHYDAVVARTDVSDAIKEVARQRKALLGHMTLAPRLAPPRAPATQPAATQPGDLMDTTTRTMPADLQSALDRLLPPTTEPTTQPGAEPQ